MPSHWKLSIVLFLCFSLFLFLPLIFCVCVVFVCLSNRYMCISMFQSCKLACSFLSFCSPLFSFLFSLFLIHSRFLFVFILQSFCIVLSLDKLDCFLFINEALRTLRGNISNTHIQRKYKSFSS